MMPSAEQVFSVLREFNPWWSGRSVAGLPTWRRAAFAQVRAAVLGASSRRAVLLGGARQVGKTTLFLQAIADGIASGVPPGSILYVTLDHPILKLAGLETVLRIWQESHAIAPGERFLFIDEIQHHADWRTWVKLQVDFHPGVRIAMTGSALRLAKDEPESALGRVTLLRLPTLSFYESMQIRRTPTPDVELPRSLSSVQTLGEPLRLRAVEACRELVPHFHDYLLRGGFPSQASQDDIEVAQRELRQDIVDISLKRDMTAIFGVRNVQQLDKVFLYLCFNDGCILSPTTVGRELQLGKEAVAEFLRILEAAHLIQRLRPLGYGKQVLRAGEKVYMADPAIPGAIMLMGRGLIQDASRLGKAVENAVFKHLAAHQLGVDVRVSYWQDAKGREVDVVVQTAALTVPFEVKYRPRAEVGGLAALCTEKRLSRAYLISREPESLGARRLDAALDTTLITIPAPLACFWLGQIERMHQPTPNLPDW